MPTRTQSPDPLAATFMETFKIKASSWIIYVLTFFVILTAGALLSDEIFQGLNTLILFIALLIISIIIIRLGGIARTEWILTDKEIQINWLSQFFFQKNPDLIIRWDEIKGYQIRSETSFDLLKIVLVNGKVIRLWHDNLITRDDFEKLVSRFLERVEEHNLSELRKTAQNSQKM